MYAIIAYDVSIERVNKIKSYLRTQLTWVQNSLFEGELNEARYLGIRKTLLELIDAEHDTITIYTLQNKNNLGREDLGVTKGNPGERVI